MGTSILKLCDIEYNIFDYTNARLRKRSKEAAVEMCVSTCVSTTSPLAVSLSINKKMQIHFRVKGRL